MQVFERGKTPTLSLKQDGNWLLQRRLKDHLGRGTQLSFNCMELSTSIWTRSSTSEPWISYNTTIAGQCKVFKTRPTIWIMNMILTIERGNQGTFHNICTRQLFKISRIATSGILSRRLKLCTYSKMYIIIFQTGNPKQERIVTWL